MPKLRAPLLSFKAQGSVGQSVTYSRVKQGTIAKRIPTHLDAQTDAQIAHRRRFISARYYWHALAQSQRDAYETAARPYHMTGWAYFLRHYLATDPHQVLWLPMDQGEGSITYDLSGKANHGTIYGASWTTGKIHNALNFDGIDNRIVVPSSLSLDINDAITFGGWVKRDELNRWDTCLGKIKSYPGEKRGGYILFFPGTNFPRGGFGTNSYYDYIGALTPLDTQFHHIMIRRSGSIADIFIDGALDNTNPACGNWYASPLVNLLLSHTDASGIHGILDEFRVYNCALTLEQIKLLALKDLT